MRALSRLIYRVRRAFPVGSERANETHPKDAWFDRFFGWSEVRTNPVLRFFYFVCLFGFLITFHHWSSSKAITTQTAEQGRHICPAYFPNCDEIYFLEALPFGFSQSLFYAGLLALMIFATGFALLKRWNIAMAIMLPMYAWKLIAMFVLTDQFKGNYHYFHMHFATIFLFFPNKLYFLRRVLVLLYFMAGILKIHEGWLIGSIFSPLISGIPLFPDVMIPFATNGVILLELVGAWLLLSPQRARQKLALMFFFLFHLYSAGLVYYMYPLLVMPPLLTLFLPRMKIGMPPFGNRAWAGWIYLTGIIFCQSYGLMIPGDAKLTLEGNSFGLYMFEANHQCRSTTDYYLKSGRVDSFVRDHTSARDRCAPYRTWFRLQQICMRRRENDLKRIAWQFDHSINGGPFYRIVDVPDACSLKYNPFWRNEWIKTPEDGAVQIGRPVQNGYF